METATSPPAIFKKRSAKSKSSVRKRPATPPPASDSSSSYSSSEDESGRRVKRRRKNAGVIAASSSKRADKPDANPELLSTIKFAADRSATIASTNDATKQSNWFDEDAAQGEADAASSKALLGTTRSLPQSTSTSTPRTNPTDKTYKGAAAYTTHIQKNADPPHRSKAAQIGPVKAPTNIRTITVTDFAPDVCKDYKQTGFCGFGDSCKFLHAREDYKQGWELDRDWEIGTKGKKVTGGRTVASAAAKRRAAGGAGADADPDSLDAADEEDEDALLEKIPFACILCRKPYTNPIVTKCGHYFCEACALQRYRKNPSCAACGAGTGGVFNGAKNLKKLLEKKRERARKRREQAIADGEEASEDEEADDEDIEE
ncbi:MAG: RNA-splicing factor [Sarea resinae]|nr:MAG: RNA-splicing factor [Sarea resinae]